MFTQLKTEFLLWTMQLNAFMQDRLGHLQPIEYCIGATFVITIGFVMLSGRR